MRASHLLRAASFAPSSKPVGIVMLNMGGPSSLDGAADGVRPFLKRLFSDKEIIQLGGGFLQRAVGSFVSSRRSPRIKEQYANRAKYTKHIYRG
jgi:protoheme ferro-lyase